jgi:hypothetical protein
MDPPDISPKGIAERYYATLDADLKCIYDYYLSIIDSLEIYPIYVFRNKTNISCYDLALYKDVQYYDKDTHCPYEDKALLVKILKMYH